MRTRDLVKVLSAKNDALKAERDALAAQVEYLKSHFNDLIEIAHRCDSWESFPQKPLDRALSTLQSLPQQCLRDVQAEAEAERDALTAKNYQLLAVLSDIQQQCIGAIAMSYPMSPEHIGQQIYQATGMTEPELRATVRQGGAE